jgi:hypothetical protein
VGVPAWVMQAQTESSATVEMIDFMLAISPGMVAGQGLRDTLCDLSIAE